jgi:hypothetical protein
MHELGFVQLIIILFLEILVLVDSLMFKVLICGGWKTYQGLEEISLRLLSPEIQQVVVWLALVSCRPYLHSYAINIIIINLTDRIGISLLNLFSLSLVNRR